MHDNARPAASTLAATVPTTALRRPTSLGTQSPVTPACPVFAARMPLPAGVTLPSTGTMRSGIAGLIVLPQRPDAPPDHLVLNDLAGVQGNSGLVVGIEPIAVNEIAIRFADPTRPATRLLDADALAQALAPGRHPAIDDVGQHALQEFPSFLSAPGLADPDQPEAHHPQVAAILHRAAARTLLALAGADITRLERRDGGVAVDRACGFMIDHIAEPLSLEDVRQSADVSARSLQYAFEARHRMGPMQWLREQRLRRLHALLSGAPRDAGVTELATAAGFTHLGRLGGLFRARFGHRPHELLEHARRG